jgi:hypothetical protein
MLSAPDLSIIGVPKAGTTSVHLWLEKRSGILAADPKETFFFMDADNPLRNAGCNFHHPTACDYASFFNALPRPHEGANLKTLDSTTHYFFQQTAAKMLAQHNTKVCVILREPVARLVSYFHYVGYVRSAFKKPIDFSLYVDTLFNETTDSIADRFTDPKEFFSLATALDQGNYQKHLQLWQSTVKPENLKVMLFEDLVSQRNTFLAEIAAFFNIAVSDADLEDFGVANEGRAVKFPTLNRWVRSLSKFTTGLPFYKTLKQRYLQLQSGDKIEFDHHQHRLALQRLHQHYRPLNEKLTEVTEIDLSPWQSRQY